jgi:hypothetical protein
MAVVASGQQHASPPRSGGDGVRVIDKRGAGRGTVALYIALAVVVVAAGATYLLLPARGSAPAAVDSTSSPAPVVELPRTAESGRTAVAVVPPTARRVAAPAAPVEEPFEVPSLDPDDLASHVRPGDPEPTAAELIEALNNAGIHSGIGAFNPPGTSPPLEGLAVPEDYELPEGFVRHYQVTDEGEPIEAILLFSPDFEFFDAEGRPIPIPENRVVPPELAPPGMPIRPVQPSPP